MTDYSTKIAALEDAMASGELTVESDGDRTTYRNMKELIMARDFFVQKQAASSSATVRPASTLAIYDPN